MLGTHADGGGLVIDRGEPAARLRVGLFEVLALLFHRPVVPAVEVLDDADLHRLLLAVADLDLKGLIGPTLGAAGLVVADERRLVDDVEPVDAAADEHRRTRDRERKLLKKVQQSLQKIDNGEYGWCEETGDPIGLARLLARPTAFLSLEAQQRRELKQKMFGD